MDIKKNITACLIASMMVVSLSGCGTKDKSAATEAATNFMEAVKTGNTDEINNYSSGEVATGYFVELFDGDYLKEELISSLGNPTLDDETATELDEFCALYSSMMEEYSITDVTMNDDGTATAYVTIQNSFPFDIVTGESAQERFAAASEQYNTDNQEELAAITSEQGSDAAVEKACNDLILIALDIYEQEIASSEPVTYMLALNLSKNEETGTWYVTSVQSYDSSIAGTGTPATETDTSATETSADNSTDAATEETSSEENADTTAESTQAGEGESSSN